MIVDQAGFNRIFDAVQEWQQGAIGWTAFLRRSNLSKEEGQRLKEWILRRRKTGAPLGRTIYLALGIEGHMGPQ